MSFLRPWNSVKMWNHTQRHFLRRCHSNVESKQSYVVWRPRVPPWPITWAASLALECDGFLENTRMESSHSVKTGQSQTGYWKNITAWISSITRLLHEPADCRYIEKPRSWSCRETVWRNAANWEFRGSKIIHWCDGSRWHRQPFCKFFARTQWLSGVYVFPLWDILWE